MLIPPLEGTSFLFDAIYQVVREDSLSCSGCTVLIFVAPNCDSICACRILTSLLRADDIPYKVLPVAGYEDLYTSANQEIVNDDLKSVVLLGCGGTVDVGALFELTEESDTMVYVLDSHRPLHLHNAFNPKVVVLYDGKPSLRDIPDAETVHEARQEVMEEYALDEDTSEYGDEDDESGEADAEYQEAHEKRAKRARTDADAPVLQYSAGEPHRSQWNAKLAELLRKRVKTRIEKEYYAGEHSGDCGTSTAVLCYTLALQTNKSSNELLWLAILGLTDQLLHGHISVRTYKNEQEKLLVEVHRFNRSEGERTDPGTGRGCRGKVVIEQSDEYVFPLYRHWNVHDAMYHSRYIASRLGIWKSQGRKRLEVLLAKAGISLVEARQSFSNMSNDAKRMMRVHLEEQAKLFNLDGMSYSSFTCSRGTLPILSAADAVYAVTSLLEFGHGWEGAGDKKVYEGNFWLAYDALAASDLRRPSHTHHIGVFGAIDGSPSRMSLSKLTARSSIYDGIGLAVELQQLVVQLGASMIEKGIIVHSGPFRYAYVPECAERSLFSRILPLRTLALFLIEYLNERNSSRKPFLLLCLDEESQSFMIAAMANSYTFSNFGVCFKKAATRTNAHLCHHAFDSSVVSVDRSDTRKFLDYMLYYFIQREGDREVEDGDE